MMWSQIRSAKRGVFCAHSRLPCSHAAELRNELRANGSHTFARNKKLIAGRELLG
jgi:hypothetical protein